MVNRKETMDVVAPSGTTLDNIHLLKSFVKEFSNISKSNGRKAIVHGGGETVDGLLKHLGIKSDKVNGIRVTDVGTLVQVAMVFQSLNSKLIHMLEYEAEENLARCEEYVGMPLWGAIPGATHTPVITVGGKEIQVGYVGEVNENHINDDIVSTIKNGFVPVMSPMAYDFEKGFWLNGKSHDIATAITVKFAQMGYDTNLTFYSGILGVLDEKRKVIPEINEPLFNELNEAGVLSPSMVSKLKAAFYALNKSENVKQICVTNCLYQKGTSIVR